MAISQAVRRQVYDRDGGVCWLCQGPVPFEVVTMDHVQPVTLGGSDDPANLRPAHRRCNSRRGNGHVPRTNYAAPYRLSLPRKTVERIERLRREGYRPFQSQVILMLEQWLEEHDAPLVRKASANEPQLRARDRNRCRQAPKGMARSRASGRRPTHEVGVCDPLSFPRGPGDDLRRAWAARVHPMRLPVASHSGGID